jgi:RimK family alpha-L-glutamate ligase
MKIMLITGVGSWENNQLFQAAKKLGEAFWVKPKYLEFDTGAICPPRVIYEGRTIDTDYDIVIYRTCRPWIARACLLGDILRGKGALVTDGIFRQSLGKMSQLFKLGSAGLPVPRTILGSDALERVDYPLVTKPIGGRKGKGIELFKDNHEVPVKLREVVGKSRKMVQSYVKAEYELRILVVMGRVIGAMKKIPQGEEFRANVALGAKVARYEPSEEQKKIAIKAAEILNTDIAGVDLIVSDGKPCQPYILEVNRIPQFQGLQKTAKFNIAEKIVKALIEECEFATKKRAI